MKKVTFLILTIILVFSCDKVNNSDPNKNLEALPIVDYEFYNLIFMPLSSTNIIVNQTDTTLNCSMAEYLIDDSLGITAQTIDACIALNNKSYFIDKNEMLSGGLTFISREEFDTADSSIELLEKYGSVSIFLLGKPIIYNNGLNAMYELNQYCGPLCGHGAIVILEKKDFGWTILRYHGTWISK